MTTIKARKAELQTMIDAYAFDVLFADQDVARFNQLTGWNFPMYKRIINTTFPKDTRCVAHSDDGQKWEVWSWNKALTPANNLMEAMRVAVAEQMQDYKGKAVRVCVACGTTALITVDHKRIPFRDIALSFIEKVGNVSLANKADGSGWEIESPEVLGAWQVFHKRHADYQILCRSCNSKKGAKHGNT